MRVADVAYIRTDLQAEGREVRELVECPQCHRITDWLIAVGEGAVEIACRCGVQWRLAAALPQVVALAECPPRDPRWTCLGDARAALGFEQQPGRRRRRRRASVLPVVS
ncbi:hypothetical protein GCM10009839_25050 [Catenulispora yoronensis]|uniref:Transcription factor zinc-finger domain-containing protein n=1 Tax=Catenulispora yoronensis TaxID=450799 RepID=A0ABN2U1J9_9ACTN